MPVKPHVRATVAAVAAASAPAPVVPPRQPVAASVDVGLVRQRFNWDWATSEDNGVEVDTYWWWAISIRVDPSEVIADDGEGNLWSIPFTTDGADVITFGEPARVRETYVPVAAATAGAAANEVASRRRQRVLATALERPTKPDRDNQAAASAGPDNEEHPMDRLVLQALARQHGLDPDTATEEQVNAAVIAATDTPEPDPEAPAAEVDTPAADDVVETPQPEPVAASVADPVVAARLEALEAQNRELVAQAEARVAADQAAQTAARVADVGAAAADGRIRPADHDQWVTRVSDPTHGEAHAATLAALPTTVPVRERGSNAASSTSTASLQRVLRGVPGLTNQKES